MSLRSGTFAVLVIVLASVVYGQEDMAYGSQDSFVEFHGMVVQEYNDYQEDGLNGGVSTFDNSYAFVNVFCDLAENLSGVIEIEFAEAGTVIEIDRAYLDYGINDYLNLRIGKFYLPFINDVAMFRPTGDDLVTSRFWGLVNSDIMRDSGFCVFGGGQLSNMPWQYEVATGNGNLLGRINDGLIGTTTFEEVPIDRNEGKTFAARFTLEPWEGITFAVSGMRTKVNLQSTAQVVVPGPPDTVMTFIQDNGIWDIQWTTASVQIVKGPWEADMYTIQGDIEVIDGPKEPYTQLHVQAAYNFLAGTDKRLAVAVRFQNVKLDITNLLGYSEPEEFLIYALGINYKPREHLSFKAEMHWEEEVDFDTNRENNSYHLSAVIDF